MTLAPDEYVRADARPLFDDLGGLDFLGITYDQFVERLVRFMSEAPDTVVYGTNSPLLNQIVIRKVSGERFGKGDDFGKNCEKAMLDGMNGGPEAANKAADYFEAITRAIRAGIPHRDGDCHRDPIVARACVQLWLKLGHKPKPYQVRRFYRDHYEPKAPTKLIDRALIRLGMLKNVSKKRTKGTT